VFGKFQELLRDSTRFKRGGVTADDQGWSFEVVHPTSVRVRTVSADRHATKYSARATCLIVMVCSAHTY
jgi:hypothetical protein